MKEMPSDRIPVPEHFRDDMEAFVRSLDGAERLLGETGAEGGASTTGGSRTTVHARQTGDAGMTGGTQASPRRGTIVLRIAAIAASVALVAMLGTGLYNRHTEPKDTFDDPYLAYAAVEDALQRVSLAAGKGLALERESEAYLQETLSVFNR